MAFRNNTTLNRFEDDLASGLAFASYRLVGETISIFHTEVPRAMRGSGAGSVFVRQVLDEVRSLGLKVDPQCGFVRAFMTKNPEFNDLLT